MRISVIIPAHNAAGTIEKQLSSLENQCMGKDIEVLVVDNKSTDETRKIVENVSTHFPALRVVVEEDRQGANAARNRGVYEATGDVILLCDADDIVSPEWIDTLTLALDAADIVGGPALAVMALNGETIELNFESVINLPNIHGYFPYVLSSNMGFRRRVVREIGGFDESFVGGHEEVDFCWRAQQCGFTLKWIPDATISYFQRSSLKKLVKQRMLYGATSIQLWERHQDRGKLNPISFTGSARNLLHLIPRVHEVFTSKSRRRYLLDAGWVTGVFIGHLRYRKFGTLGPTSIPELQLSSDTDAD